MIEDAGGALDRPRKASADSETPLLISNLVIEGILENAEAQEEPTVCLFNRTPSGRPGSDTGSV